jgi:hypothetical protein
MARTKKAKQWTGTLAEPIDDVFLVMPMGLPVNSLPNWIELYSDRLHRLRIEKMPELARQLGMQVDTFDLTTEHGLMVFYRQLAMGLARKLEIPGFIAAKPKWPRAMVLAAMEEGDARRSRRERDPDFAACLSWVRAADPDLARKDRAFSSGAARDALGRITLSRFRL